MTDLIPAIGELRGKTFHLPVRVYYEDTDQQAIVFYANYLKFFERGRTEFLRTLGAPPAQIETDLDRLFVVAGVNIRYHQSARLDEILDVQTRVAKLGRVKLLMDQKIYRGEDLIASAELTIAIIDRQGKPARLTQELEARFQALLA